MLKTIFSLILFLTCLSALACPATESVRSNAFQEVETLSDIPLVIRQDLGFEEAGLKGVAKKGQPFNKTDDVDSTLPMRRFLVAAREGDNWLIALEQGGRAYNVQAYLYSSSGKKMQHWVLTENPKSLAEVKESIANLPSK
jgi:hypothetical protein